MLESYTNEQVNRWCEIAEKDGKLWGAMEERRRIVNLLENEIGAGVDINDNEARDKAIQRLIKLIEETE